ncbi:MAG: tRNA (adenosine(37)-N6)-threonylcarbamoyltransferase complex ATPase subunit type 1 TsaE [Anaerolineae bacterium]
MIKRDEGSTLKFSTNSVEETLQIGIQLGRLLRSGDVVCLEGELGAGKTYLTQGIGRGLGIKQGIRSPSFTLIDEHRWEGGTVLYHIDLYRLQTVPEMLGIGLTDYLEGPGVCVIEWAERAREIIPPEHLWITLLPANGDRRDVVMEAAGERYETLLRDLQALGVESD